MDLPVNGLNLTEIDGGEVAVTNLHSCNGPDFVIDIRFSTTVDKAGMISQSELPSSLLLLNQAN